VCVCQCASVCAPHVGFEGVGGGWKGDTRRTFMLEPQVRIWLQSGWNTAHSKMFCANTAPVRTSLIIGG
jgi:hypothetical protein